MWPKAKLKNRQFHISENEIMKTFRLVSRLDKGVVHKALELR